MEMPQSFKAVGNALLAVLLVSGARIYDVGTYWVSNSFEYFSAVIFISLFLVVLSIGFILLHGFCSRKYNWDVFGLGHLCDLANGTEPEGISDRIAAWTISKGRNWINIIGPCTLGPFIVALLLRKRPGWKESAPYVIFGSIFSAMVWVALWKGLGIFTWDSYVKPVLSNLGL